MKPASAYEVRCPSCDVSAAPGTRRCIHCGGPVRDSRPDSDTRLTTTPAGEVPMELEAEEPGGELETRPQPPRGLRLGVTALWVLLAFALGGVLGILTSLGIILRLRTQLLAANRKLSRQGQAPETPDAEPVEPAENP